MKYRTALAAFALGGLLATTAAGQQNMAQQESAKRGHALAKQWCASCHVVEKGTAEGSDVAPSFAQIAQTPSITPGALRAWLSDPHPPMPNLSLSRGEIDALVAYLQSLRS